MVSADCKESVLVQAVSCYWPSYSPISTIESKFIINLIGGLSLALRVSSTAFNVKSSFTEI